MKAMGTFRPTTIDRTVFGILASFHILGGLYLVGPWYLDLTDGIKSPLYSMFNEPRAVAGFGALLLINGLSLVYAAAGRGKHYTRITTAALMWGFLIRLYALLGVFLTIESWRPPSYLSSMVTVSVLGAYWVWVRVCARPTE